MLYKSYEARESPFSQFDCLIVRAAMRRLPGLARSIVKMRFWKSQTPVEIAEGLGVSVRAVEKLLKKSERLLREECLRHPAFSRSQHKTIQSIQSQNTA